MSKSSNTGFLFKSGLFALIIGALYYFFNIGNNPNAPEAAQTDASPQPTESSGALKYLPSGGRGALVQHTYFSLAYNETH